MNIRQVTAIAFAALGLTACGGGSGDDATPATNPVVTVIPTTTEPAPTTQPPVVTVTPPPTTEAPTPATTEPPTTTGAPTTVPEAADTVGVVWHSQVDPARVNAEGQPVFEGAGVTARLDLIFYTAADGDGSVSQGCRDAIDEQQAQADHCLLVQWSFDVAADVAGGEGWLETSPVLTPDGLQIDAPYAASGLAGAKNRTLVVVYPGGVPGMDIAFDLTSGDYNDTAPQTFTVPPLEAMQPYLAEG
jgi:hypothetical protein